MAVIGDLTVLLDANTRGLQSGLARARGALNSMAGAMTGLIGAGGFAALVQGGLNSADALQKASIRTGLTVESLSGLRHAAALSDISFESLTGSLVRMGRRLGLAAEGSKAQVKALETLGLSVEDITALTPDEQFLTLAQAMSELDSASERAVAGQALFGDAFKALLPLMEGGRAGILAMTSEADKFGLTMSRDMVDGAAAALDEMTKLQAIFQGVAATIAVEFAPKLSAALESLQEGLPAVLDVVGSVISGVATAFNVVGTALGGTAATLGALLSGNFREAVSINASATGDILDMLFGGDDGGEDLSEAQQRGNQILERIERNTAEPRAAVAG